MAKSNKHKCPNVSHPEFKKLERLLPGQAYTIWDANNGGLEVAPNGEPSKLWAKLLELHDGNEQLAANAKARIYTRQYAKMANESIVNLDENGEPTVIVNPDGFVHVNGYGLAQVEPEGSEVSELKESVKQAKAEQNLPMDERSVEDQREAEALRKYSEERLRLMDRLGTTEHQKYIEDLVKNASAQTKKIIDGLKTRIQSLKKYTGPLAYHKVQTLEREVAEYEALRQQSEDQELVLKFIKNIANETVDNRKRIEEAHAEYRKNHTFSMRTDQLVQLKTDFLGFYKPLIEQIQANLYTGGYFDNLTTNQKINVRTSIDLAATAFNEIEGYYTQLLLNRVGEIVKKYGDAHNSPTIDAYLAANGLNTTESDISTYHRFIGSLRNVDDELLRMLHAMIVETNNEVEAKSIDDLADFVKLGSKVGNKQQFYEKNSKGANTGKLVRDLNFGEHAENLDAFMKELGAEAPLAAEALKEWRRARNKWHAENTERRYTPEYYELFNDLSQAATMARDAFSIEINKLLQTVTDKQGNIHLENMSNEDYARLETYYVQKKALGVKFNFDGTTKSGVDFDVAEEIGALNNKLSENLSFKVNKAKFTAAMKEKRNTLPPEKFKKWYERNTRLAYTEDFTKLLDQTSKRSYGEEYEQINKDRRDFLSLFRTNASMQVDVKRMSTQALAKVRQMDRALQDIRKRSRARSIEKGDVKFGEIAEITVTDRYKADKQAAIERDKLNPGAYDAWRIEHHWFDDKGVMHPYSYYTFMVPKKKAYMERVPSNEFSEMDESSPFVNSNFDPSYGSNYVPRRDKYDNTEAYKKATDTPLKRQYYDAITDVIQKTNTNARVDNSDAYTLPQISGTLWAFTRAGDGVARGIRNYFAARYMQRGEDVEYLPTEQKAVKPDGQELKSIPRHYVQKLHEPGSISRDLQGILMQYYRMGINYKIKSEKAPIFEVIQQIVDNRALASNNSRKLSIAGKVKKALSSIGRSSLSGLTKQSKQSNASARVNTLLQMNLYGERKAPMSIPIGNDRHINAAKVFSLLKQKITTIKLGLSPFVWAKNFATSAHQGIVEGHAGKFYNKATAVKATLELSKQYLRTITQWGDYAAENKLMAMMNMNRVVRSVDESFSRLNYNRFARFAMNHLWYGGMTAGDYMIKSHNMVAIYMSHKYIPGKGFMTEHEYVQSTFAERTKGMTPNEQRAAYNSKEIDKEAKRIFRSFGTPTLYDIYKADGVKAVVKPEYKSMEKYLTPELKNKVTNTIHYLNERADGQLSEEDKGVLHRNVILSYTLMLRQYLVQAIDDRLIQPKQWNYLTQDWDEAMYRSVLRTVGQDIKHGMDILRYVINPSLRAEGQRRPEKDRYDANERYYRRRIALDLSLQIAYKMVLALFIRKMWEEDPFDWKKSALALFATQTIREVQNLYDPIDIFKSLKSISPAFDEVETLWEVFHYIATDPDKKILYGVYAGWPKWAQKTIKLTPFKNLYEAKDPNQKIKYVTTQLQNESILENLATKMFTPKRKEASFIKRTPEERKQHMQDMQQRMKDRRIERDRNKINNSNRQGNK